MTLSALFTLSVIINIVITPAQSSTTLECALKLNKSKQCPIDGGWTLWSTWSVCQGECGNVGFQVRVRNCTNPTPFHGADCNGDQRDVKPCGVPGCTFEQYEKLLRQDSVHLLQLRALKQLSNSQNALLTKCISSHCEFQTVSQTLGEAATKFWNALQCVKKNIGCPEAGGWGEWSPWSRCSALCGEGQQIRCRACCAPPPSTPNNSCYGQPCVYQSCIGSKCGKQNTQGVWNNWSEWSSCSAACNLGITRRTRVCQNLGQNKRSFKSHSGDVNRNMRSYDDTNYYDIYWYDNYDLDKNIDNYEEGILDKANSIIKKRDGSVCETKIEYYSTEEDEDFSTASPFSVNSPKYNVGLRTKTQKVPSEASTWSMFTNLEELLEKPNGSVSNAITEYYSTEEEVDYPGPFTNVLLSTISKSSIENVQTDKHSTSKVNLKNLLPTVNPKTDNVISTELKTIAIKEKSSTKSLKIVHSTKSQLHMNEEKTIQPLITLAAKTTSEQTKISKLSTSPPLSGITETYLNKVAKSGNCVEQTMSQKCVKGNSRKKITSPTSKETSTDTSTSSSINDLECETTKILAPSKQFKKVHKQNTGLPPEEHVSELNTKQNSYPPTKVDSCNRDLEKYEKTTVVQDTECTGELHKSDEDIDISIFGNICGSEEECQNKELITPCDEPKSVEPETIETSIFALESSVAPNEDVGGMSLDDFITITNPSTETTTNLQQMLDRGPTISNRKKTKSNASSLKSTLPLHLNSSLEPIQQNSRTTKMPTETSTFSFSNIMTQATNPTTSSRMAASSNISISKTITSSLVSSSQPTSPISTDFKTESTSHLNSVPQTNLNHIQQSKLELTTLISTSMKPISRISLENSTKTSIENSLQTMIYLTETDVSLSSFDKVLGTSISISASTDITQELTTEENLEIGVFSESSNQTESETTNQRFMCDLEKVLHLPNFNDSFISDGCKGPFEEIKPCNFHVCNGGGGWSSWSSWSECIPDCGIGNQLATRSCTRPEQSDSKTSCIGDKTTKRQCFQQPCPVMVGTSRAMLTTAQGYIKFNALHQHSSVLMIYMRLRVFTCNGSIFTRNKEDRVFSDHVRLSLYNCYLLLSVRVHGCIGYLLSSIPLSIGDWHEVLVTVVGATITMRLDDHFSTESEHLSCQPFSPDYDSAMKVGGHFIGEVDRIKVNFQNYDLQKTKTIPMDDSESSIDPVESFHVQFSLNNKETPTLSLDQFLLAPCFLNQTTWKLDVAIKPQFSHGLVLYFQGYGQKDYLVVSLEHYRVRLRVRTLSAAGECELPHVVATNSWIHIGINKPATKPVGLAVNGAESCFANLYGEANYTDEPDIHCRGGIFLGEVPVAVKEILQNDDDEHREPLQSPLGLLGRLTVENHSIDLTKLPRMTPPDMTNTHPSSEYKLSSFTASTTAHYEEAIVFQERNFSLTCVYDFLFSEASQKSFPSQDRNRDASEFSAKWFKLDLLVKTAFEKSRSNVTHQISEQLKSTTLTVFSDSETDSIEGFYSCSLSSPLLSQPGLNIITYSVVLISDDQGKKYWFGLQTVLYFSIFALLVTFMIWLMVEATFNCIRKSGFYYCRKLDDEHTQERVHSLIFCEKGKKQLGSIEACNEAYSKYLLHLEIEALKHNTEEIVEQQEDENNMVENEQSELQQNF